MLVPEHKHFDRVKLNSFTYYKISFILWKWSFLRRRFVRAVVILSRRTNDRGLLRIRTRTKSIPSFNTLTINVVAREKNEMNQEYHNPSSSTVKRATVFQYRVLKNGTKVDTFLCFTLVFKDHRSFHSSVTEQISSIP